MEARIRCLSRVSGRESNRAELAKALEPYGASLWEAVSFLVAMQSQFQPALSEHQATVEEAIRFFLKHEAERTASREFRAAFEEFKAAKSNRRHRTKDDYTHVSGKLEKHRGGGGVQDHQTLGLHAASPTAWRSTTSDTAPLSEDGEFHEEIHFALCKANIRQLYQLLILGFDMNFVDVRN